MKLRSEVVKLCLECSLISPFIARCTPTIAPATPAKTTAINDKSFASMRSRTETRTASTVTTAAAMRRWLIGFLPPPVNPMRSTIRDVAPCPAIDATE